MAKQDARKLSAGDLKWLYGTVTGKNPLQLGFPFALWRSAKAYVESLGGKLRLFFLPPYSPELNPDELVWNDVKNNAVGRMRLEKPADPHRASVGRLRYLQNSPARVRSFFQAPETRYAA